MNKPRKAKLLKVEQETLTANLWNAPSNLTSGTVLLYVATDTAGRRFRDTTEQGAIKMLEKYNDV